MEGVASSPWSALAYLIAGVLFILALRGFPAPAPAGRATVTA
jgi:NAD(P) transhydrogenase subunit beta